MLRTAGSAANRAAIRVSNSPVWALTAKATSTMVGPGGAASAVGAAATPAKTKANRAKTNKIFRNIVIPPCCIM